MKMSRLFKVLVSHCWSNAYLIIGVCMGLSVSLFLAPVERDADDGAPRSFPSNLLQDEYEPKINVGAKPQQARKVLKSFVRPRYYSTELGIREKLFVGILTSQEYLHSRGVALNKTIAHLVGKVRYFISISEGVKPNVSLPGIVGFTDHRSVLMPFHVMKYIMDNYLEDYDYYFLVKDTGYIHARRLNELLTKVAVSQDVHMGAVAEIPPYCSLESGILLSNSIVRELRPNLDWCVRNSYSDSDDVNFGRCVVHSTSVPCSDRVQGQVYQSRRLSSEFRFEQDFVQSASLDKLASAVVVYPIYDHRVIYKFHVYFAAVSSLAVQRAIASFREASVRTVPSCPIDRQDFGWPVGERAGSRASTRFDVLRWTYFNNSHVLLDSESSTARKMGSNTRLDVDRAVRVAVDGVIGGNDRPLVFEKLSNGYRRFDASRGMDYLLDLDFQDIGSGTGLRKRIQLFKPVGKVEILPVPYVTENSRINMILVVDDRQKEGAIDFVRNYARVCMQEKQKTFLMVVLLYEYDASSKGKEDAYYEIKRYALDLTEKYKKDRSKIGWLSIRLPSATKSVVTDPITRLAVADLCSRKLPADSLMLFVEPRMDLKLEYLNRVRMNTISQYQIFSPIPFVEYNPDVTRANDSLDLDLDINRNYGKYDQLNYDHIAFYAKDYLAMRKTVELDVPLVRSDKDIPRIWKELDRNAFASFFDLFVSFSGLHCLRAVEPALKIRYKEINCQNLYNGSRFSADCLSRKYYGLGQRSQLAKLVLDYRHSLN